MRLRTFIFSMFCCCTLLLLLALPAAADDPRCPERVLVETFYDAEKYDQTCRCDCEVDFLQPFPYGVIGAVQYARCVSEECRIDRMCDYVPAIGELITTEEEDSVEESYMEEMP